MKKSKKVTADPVSFLGEGRCGHHSSRATSSGYEEAQSGSEMAAEDINTDDEENDMYSSYIRSTMPSREMEGTEWESSVDFQEPDEDGESPGTEKEEYEAMRAPPAHIPEEGEAAFAAAAYENESRVRSYAAHNLMTKEEVPLRDEHVRGTPHQQELYEEVIEQLRLAAQENRLEMDGSAISVCGIEIEEHICQDWLRVGLHVGGEDLATVSSEQ